MPRYHQSDGSVQVEIGTQDLGTGTRTIITQVAAETLGLPMGAIKLAIGSNDLPPDGASGGSTTVGGVSASTRKASVNALDKLFDAVAPALGTSADRLEAAGRPDPREGQSLQEPDLDRGLQEDRRRRDDLRDGRQRTAQSRRG